MKDLWGDDIPEEVKRALIDGIAYICIRLERVYDRRENFSPIAKMLMDLALAEKNTTKKELVVEDLFVATDHVITLIDDLELFLDSKIH